MAGQVHPHVLSLIASLHPKQKLVFESSARQILFGGAAGPGKSHLLRVAALAWASRIPRLQVYLFRRKFPDLYSNHMEGPSSFPELLRPLVAEGLAKINYSNHEITFANGSHIRLAHMQHEKDKENIHGAEIHLALIDELTHFTKSQYAFIRSRVRMVGVEIPPAYEGLFPRIICGSNPGSSGHNFVKALFVDPAPPEKIWVAPPEEGGLTTQFIPAFLRDNPSMTKDDPEYANRLRGLDNNALVRAMLEGDWDVVAGGMFDEVWERNVHVIPPFPIPRGWYVDRSHDWGSSAPFATLWLAESNGEAVTRDDGSSWWVPKGSIFVINEDYGWNSKPNEGLRMTNVAIGQRIKQIDTRVAQGLAQGHMIRPGPADLQIFQITDGRSIHADYLTTGVRFLDNADKGPGSRVTGWKRIYDMLSASLQSPLEHPCLFVFNTCPQLIRTLPVLPRDVKNPDDVGESEDHLADALRYRLVKKVSGRSSAEIQGV